MKWKGRRNSANVEDRRGKGGIAIAGGGLGLVLIIIVTLLGGNSGDFINKTEIVPTGNTEPYEESAEDQELSEFVSVVLADTEDVWTEIFDEQGLSYQKPTLVLFSGSVASACGAASAAVGPFYCPADYKLYIDLSFFKELEDQFNAPGDFAMAYVIAHEVGHHVQTILGINEEVNSLHPKLSKNEYSVRLELQADYFAGVWGYHAESTGLLEAGDLEEALQAASAIGDDRIQQKAQGYVVPDSFTHGTSEQRVRWFSKGFETGSINEGDTFNAREL